MATQAQHQSVFRVKKPEATTIGTESRISKRNRQPVSCEACRTRKLKCDRQQPCSTCSKRSDKKSCTYSNTVPKRHDKPPRVSQTSEAHARLQKLERMIDGLAKTAGSSPHESNGSKTSPNTTSETRSTELHSHESPQSIENSSDGHLDKSGSGPRYIGATNWATILENIREIQGALEPNEDDVEDHDPSNIGHGPDVVFDKAQTLTLSDVLAALPPRGTVDRLLSLYFGAGEFAIPVIHSAKFLREYESFWADPSSTSFLWISLLFSALFIGAKSDEANNPNSSTFNSGSQKYSFMTKAGQALVIGKYLKARPYSVEAVILHAVCKYTEKEDPDADAWMIMGIAARLAMRMGYHRDPRHLTSISAFEGEMRRRTFMIVAAFDVLLSFQAGLPAIIQEDECDTEAPSNLFDTDFDEDCAELPSSRPPTDPTPMLYYVYKCQLGKMFRRVNRHVLTLRDKSYEDTMRLDDELRKEHSKIPPYLRMKPLGLSFTDSTSMIYKRLNAEVTYLKCLCVLHRNHISHERSNPAFAYSRKTCIYSALQLLQYQADLHAICQPGRQFYKDKWFISSLSLHDFLLAAMIICLDICESHRDPSTADLDAQASKYDALKVSHDIWVSRRDFSRDARRASDVLATMLARIPRPSNNSRASSSTVTTATVSANGSRTTLDSDNPFFINGSLAGDINLSRESNQDMSSNDLVTASFGELNLMSTIFSSTENIGWGPLDQYLLDDIPIDWSFLDDSGPPAPTSDQQFVF